MDQYLIVLVIWNNQHLIYAFNCDLYHSLPNKIEFEKLQLFIIYNNRLSCKLPNNLILNYNSKNMTLIVLLSNLFEMNDTNNFQNGSIQVLWEFPLGNPAGFREFLAFWGKKIPKSRCDSRNFLWKLLAFLRNWDRLMTTRIISWYSIYYNAITMCI